MLPRPPARRPQLGFVYVPPFRVQGHSVAGEATVVQVPELDVAFDIGECPRSVLSAKYVALSHGHMDHIGAMPYFFSQRNFQGMGVGNLVCHPEIEQAIHNVMQAWIPIERQRTPYNVIPLAHGAELEIKNNHYLRAFETAHTCPAMGYVVVEKRSKLKPELLGLPQEKLMELKKNGEQITHTLEFPLVCYTGDTMWGPHFEREDVLNAQILITECTFVDPSDQKRAAVGKHLHLSDIARLLEVSKAEAIILTHLSRRTTLLDARKQIDMFIPADQRHRLHILMDNRTNKSRYEQMEQAQV